MRVPAIFAAFTVTTLVGAFALFGVTPSATVATSTLTPGPTPTTSEGFFFGDYDCNNVVEMDDALVGLDVLSQLLGSTTTGTPCEPNADLDCDEDFDGVDILAIVRFVAELPLTFPDCPSVGELQFTLSTECANLSEPLAIPDGSGSATLTFNFPESEEVLGLALCLDIDHPFVGDLIVTLTHDDTTTAVTLVDRAGNPAGSGNCTGHGQGFIVLFADSAAETLQEHCTDPANSEFIDDAFRPEEPLSTFNGEDVHGTWTVTVTDAEPGNPGVVLGSTFTYIYQADDTTLTAQAEAQPIIQ